MIFKRARTVVLALGLGVAGCGTDCLSIAREYAQAKGYALSCDINAAADQCSARRPVVDYVQNGTQLTIDGLGSCTHAVNPAHLAELDSILGRYYQHGCKLLPLPVCQTVVDRCYVDPQGQPVCWE